MSLKEWLNRMQGAEDVHTRFPGALFKGVIHSGFYFSSKR